MRSVKAHLFGGLHRIFTPACYAFSPSLLTAVGQRLSGATEIIHVGQAVLSLGGGLDYFLKTVFNYPTLAECYKVAAYNAANKLALLRHATGAAVLETPRHATALLASDA